MKNRIGLLMAAVCCMISSCVSFYAKSGSPIGPGDPVYPATNSIIPLEKGRVWTYSFTEFDSSGTKVIAHGLDYHVSIANQFGIIYDTTLVPLDRYNYQVDYSDYAYTYENEFSREGHIVMHRRLGPLEERGLYLIGQFHDTTIKKYPEPQLWLAYPADSGRKWQYKANPLGDSTDVTQMELLSVKYKAYILDESSISGIMFYDSCYLYKQTRRDTVAYYTYHEKVGNLGYQQYISGRLYRTLILKSLIPSSPPLFYN